MRTWQMTRGIQCEPPERPLEGTLELVLVDDPGNLEFFEPLMTASHAARGVEVGTDAPVHLDGREVHPYYLTAKDPGAITRFMADARVEVPEGHRVAMERLVDYTGDQVDWKTWYLVGDPVITEAHVSHASASIHELGLYPIVTVELTEEGARLFEQFTGDHVGERVAILVDGQVMSAPVIMERIPGGRIQVSLGASGPFDEHWCQAQELARVLGGGDR